MPEEDWLEPELPPGVDDVMLELPLPGVAEVLPDEFPIETPGPPETTLEEPEELLPAELPDELLPDVLPELLPEADAPVRTLPSIKVPFNMDCKPSLV